QRCLGVVERQGGLVGGPSGGEQEIAGVFQLRGEVRVDGGENVEAAVEGRVHAGGEVGDVLEDDLGDAGGLAPVVVVAVEGDGAALAPVLKCEGPRTVLRGLQVGGVIGLEDEAGRAGQCEQEVLVRLGQRDHDSGCV